MNFIQESMRTESSQFNDLTNNGVTYSKERLLHACLGMQTESAEFSDAIKKSLFYGIELDVINLKEELGDMLWYIAIAMDELGTDFTTEQIRVVNKLKVRFPTKFTNIDAENRDLESERQVLEQ